MDPNLTPHEKEALNQFLEIVNEIRIQHNTSNMSTKTALKFLMARKFDVHRSLALYEAHEMTRYREGLATFEPNSQPLKAELETGKFTVLPVHDSIGAAIAMFSAGKHFPSETSHQTTLKGVVYQMDVALEDVATQRSGIVFIYNMIGSKYSNFDYELSQKILSLLKGAYPARLKKVLIVMAPIWFRAPFKILRLFVREKLRDRVFMVNVSQLGIHIPANALPRELGGQLEVNHMTWLSRCLQSQSSDINELCSLTSSKSFSLNTTGAQSDGAIIGNISKHFSEQTNNGFSDEDEPSSANSEKCLNIANNVDKNGSILLSTDSAHNSNSISKTAKCKPDVISVPTHNMGSDQNNSYQNGKSCETETTLDDEEEEDQNAGMSVEEFIQHLKDTGRRGLHDEYSAIKARGPDGTFEVSRLRVNQCKNRYTDVPCYDRTRVKLSLIDGDPNTDYLNGNYVNGYKQKNAFISTQGIAHCFY
ncbi:unnamed protein product [Medioppia subpectinata]|uniref:CRAL-TRIO domain-containing protein n=1 Tax=Medioppia subpectinata TaxID=1979941 RepID=A0A7R9KMS6_9ACAR|nr:unnamed protein product [Medioppia subpectinata]CAG2106473.1 unnamed protein product [Medioppia subpectinata]